MKVEILRTKITPPDLAKRWGISPSKVTGWIKKGELRAINAATQRGGRPRYLIDEVDILAFEARRTEHVPVSAPTRKRKTSVDVIEFF